MLRQRAVIWMFWAGMLALNATAVRGQNFPDRPIHVLTADAGGGGDFVTRIVAQGLASVVGQQVITDPRGGNAIIRAMAVAKARPDGYTLLLDGDTVWIIPLMQDNVPYDPVLDFSPIAPIASSPNVLVVHPSLPVKSVKELIALAKARPGELNYSSGVTGSSSHLAGELFNAMAGVNIVRVTYKGSAPATIAILAGQVHVMYATAQGLPAQLKAGRLRALAVTKAQPSALFPGVPTVAASGVPGYETGVQYSIYAPAKTPVEIVRRLNLEIARVLGRADVIEKFREAALETATSTPEQFVVALKSDMAKWGKIIKDAGIHAN